MLDANMERTAMRAQIDRIVDDIFERAQEMIDQGVAVRTAFRLAISWELEATTLRERGNFYRALSEIPQLPPTLRSVDAFFKPKSG